jgi:hypothetical protein
MKKSTFVKASDAFYNSSSNLVVAADFTYTDPQDLSQDRYQHFKL